jgi:hypothetical protein
MSDPGREAPLELGVAPAVYVCVVMVAVAGLMAHVGPDASTPLQLLVKPCRRVVR